MRVYKNAKLLATLVNKQFEISKIDFSMEKILSEEEVVVGKKKEIWYNHYKFDDENQYMEWRNWMEEQLKKYYVEGYENEAMFIDLVYGMNYK